MHTKYIIQVTGFHYNNKLLLLYFKINGDSWNQTQGLLDIPINDLHQSYALKALLLLNTALSQYNAEFHFVTPKIIKQLTSTKQNY
jgi:hypothetical protein